MNEIKEKAIVVSVEEKGRAEVIIHKSSFCNHCPQKGACFTLDPQEGIRKIKVKNNIGAKSGDLVYVSIPSGRIIEASFWVYLFPVIIALITAYLLTKLYGQKIATVGFFIGIVAGIIITKVISKKSKDRFEVVIDEVISSGSDKKSKE